MKGADTVFGAYSEVFIKASKSFSFEEFDLLEIACMCDDLLYSSYQQNGELNPFDNSYLISSSSFTFE